ncbi:hypothetical protein CAPTEDRAFT_187942 [Capitella teleta]|uniref:Uncharacterized protein n=1 Tax=Capitella teleta TaxID=283909 RepID=R7U4S2_CAPTE|nr:hypothetical protein CAPTEDRAFT_187942 [Capitella teleta]|eukprot:ELU01116.1 hypothetical protein CAPTEDRAFT_187942 [Capitella teleta]
MAGILDRIDAMETDDGTESEEEAPPPSPPPPPPQSRERKKSLFNLMVFESRPKLQKSLSVPNDSDLTSQSKFYIPIEAMKPASCEELSHTVISPKDAQPSAFSDKRGVTQHTDTNYTAMGNGQTATVLPPADDKAEMLKKSAKSKTKEKAAPKTPKLQRRGSLWDLFRRKATKKSKAEDEAPVEKEEEDVGEGHPIEVKGYTEVEVAVSERFDILSDEDEWNRTKGQTRWQRLRDRVRQLSDSNSIEDDEMLNKEYADDDFAEAKVTDYVQWLCVSSQPEFATMQDQKKSSFDVDGGESTLEEINSLKNFVDDIMQQGYAGRSRAMSEMPANGFLPCCSKSVENDPVKIPLLKVEDEHQSRGRSRSLADIGLVDQAANLRKSAAHNLMSGKDLEYGRQKSSRRSIFTSPERRAALLGKRPSLKLDKKVRLDSTRSSEQDEEAASDIFEDDEEDEVDLEEFSIEDFEDLTHDVVMASIRKRKVWFGPPRSPRRRMKGKNTQGRLSTIPEGLKKIEAKIEEEEKKIGEDEEDGTPRQTGRKSSLPDIHMIILTRGSTRWLIGTIQIQHPKTDVLSK